MNYQSSVSSVKNIENLIVIIFDEYSPVYVISAHLLIINRFQTSYLSLKDFLFVYRSYTNTLVTFKSETNI